MRKTKAQRTKEGKAVMIAIAAASVTAVIVARGRDYVGETKHLGSHSFGRRGRHHRLRPFRAGILRIVAIHPEAFPRHILASLLLSSS